MAIAPEGRFRDADLTLHGVPGVNLEFASANPVNYFEAITGDGGERLIIDGKLFPASDGAPLVIVVPGSAGVCDNHATHAETLVGEGYAVFLLDPFGPRSVVSTIANQTQYSFAASALDVVAAVEYLARLDGVDPTRIATQGHSRGGSAVLTAATRVFAEAVAADAVEVAGVFAVYPWCGHQFVAPSVGTSVVRAIIGERDDWVSVQEAQAEIRSIALAGGAATIRVVASAEHSFDRLEPVHAEPDARVAPRAATVLVDASGAMIDPRTEVADSALTERDLFVAAVKAGIGQRGAHLGGEGDQPEVFKAEMLAFHRSVLGEP